MNNGRSMKGYKKSKNCGGKKYKMTMKSMKSKSRIKYGKGKSTKNGRKNFTNKCRSMMEMRRTMSRMRHIQ